MSAATPSRLGELNALGGDAKALFYKLFTGEVITAFDQATIFMGLHRQRNIMHGKSAGFANTGRAVGRYHVPGAELLGQKIKHAETTINVDDLLVADVFIAKIDELMNHYEVRGEYARQLGFALARTYDKQAARNVVKAARTANDATGGPGGTVVTLSAGYATAPTTAAEHLAKATELAETFYSIRQAMEEKNADTSKLVAVVSPADYYRLVKYKDLMNRDWGGSGSYQMAELPYIAGVPIMKSNFIPRQNDVVDGTGHYPDNGDYIHSNHAGNYSKVQCVLFTPDAIGTVNLMDINTEAAWDPRRRGTLLVAEKACGTGVLNPACAAVVQIP